MNSSIRCVAFDAVGTLIYPEPSVSKVYWQVGSQFGTTYTHEEVRARFQQTFQQLAPGARNDYSTSETEEYERWRQIVRTVLDDIHDIDHCFEKLHAHFGKPDAWRCFPDVAETLEGLVSRGISISVASNFDARLNAVCDELPELQHLRRRLISAHIGWHKPSPHFYSKLVTQAECPAEQILMIGDDRDNDVIAARAAGLQALLINRNGAAMEDEITDLRQIFMVFDSRHADVRP